MKNLDELVDLLAAALSVRVERALAPVVERVAKMERAKILAVAEVQTIARGVLPDAPPPIDPAPLVAAEVAKAIEQLPKPKDGRDGKDGADAVVDHDVVKAILSDLVKSSIDKEFGENGRLYKFMTDAHDHMQEMVEKEVAALPAPKDGKDGANGKDGAAGERGEKGDPGESVHPDTVLRMVSEAVAKIPPAPAGKDADPLVMAESVRDEVSRQFEAIRPHIKGERGDPGAGLRDMTMELRDEGRTIVFGLVGESFTKEIEVVAPWQIYRGVFEMGRSYKRGDVVTYGGSSWTALEDTKDAPGKSGAWQLSVKKGKDA